MFDFSHNTKIHFLSCVVGAIFNCDLMRIFNIVSRLQVAPTGGEIERIQRKITVSTGVSARIKPVRQVSAVPLKITENLSFHNTIRVFICIFLLLSWMFLCASTACAQHHSVPQKTNAGKVVVPHEVTVRLLSIRHISELSLSSGSISISSQGKTVTGGRFNIRMIPGSRTLIVTGTFGEISLPSPIEIKSINPVSLKVDGLNSRTYLTPLYIRNTGEQLIVTCRMPLEEYIAGVVWGEIPEGKGAALLAQAVVARSYALKNIQKHKNEGFDFCDCTHCQVYRGFVPPGSPFRSAAYSTKWMVLMYKGQIIDGLYHSTCGGYTSNPEDVYGSKEPGVRGIKDSVNRENRFLCEHSPHFRWEYRIKGNDLQKILSKDAEFSSLKKIANVKIERKDSAGRVILLIIEEKERRFPVSGYDFWQIIGSRKGWGKFKSTLFTVNKEGDNYIFKGRGLGHGLGMCQWGAMRMAEKGYSFREILRHYFPESKLGIWK